MCYESPQPDVLYDMCFPNLIECAGCVCGKARRHGLSKQGIRCDEPGLAQGKAIGSWEDSIIVALLPVAKNWRAPPDDEFPWPSSAVVSVCV